MPSSVMNRPGKARPFGVTGEVYRPDELAHIQSAFEAVCDELGVKTAELARRRAIAERVMNAYRQGRRHSLNLVHAGLLEEIRKDPSHTV